MMYQGSKPTTENLNRVEEFTVLFWDDFIQIDGATMPVGQCTTDLLNMEPGKINLLRTTYVDFAERFTHGIMNPDMNNDLALVAAAQDKMNKVWDAAFELPPFCYMKLDKDFSKSLLITAFTRHPEDFERVAVRMSREQLVMTELLLKLQRLYSDAISFCTYITALLEVFYERLRKRDAEHYAVGIYSLLSDTSLMNRIASTLPPHPDMLFKQSSAAAAEYAPMPNPADKTKYVVAERLVFESLGDFLRADFFRGVMRGNAPRRCHNCGRYFLLTRGYDVRYCTGVAPGETERTCRQVGAHKKEQRRDGKTPAQKEYYKTYNRLKTRKSRGKISADEWNQKVALAQDLRDRADQGEISEFELKQMLDRI